LLVMQRSRIGGVVLPWLTRLWNIPKGADVERLLMTASP
jgi:hypothetical protein